MFSATVLKTTFKMYFYTLGQNIESYIKIEFSPSHKWELWWCYGWYCMYEVFWEVIQEEIYWTELPFAHSHLVCLKAQQSSAGFLSWHFSSKNEKSFSAFSRVPASISQMRTSRSTCLCTDERSVATGARYFWSKCHWENPSTEFGRGGYHSSHITTTLLQGCC